MKKVISLALVVLGIAFLLGLASCSSESGSSSGESTITSGQISGKVTYSNVGDGQNGGIMVTLDRTDGLRTSAVTRSIESRSVVNGARTVVSSSTTSADGSYSFSDLEPGTYTVYASSSYSKEKAVYTNAVVRADETTVVDSLNLTATGSITGTITIDGNYWGNTGFLVFIAGTSYMAMTDDSGNYTISDVPAGEDYQVVAMKNGVIHNLRSWITVYANDSANIGTEKFTRDELESTSTGGKGEQGEQGVQGEKGNDGVSIVWCGSYESSGEIYNPEYLNAYFNTTDGCSYIYNGSSWELLARSGANGADGENGSDGKDGVNGKSITWMGEFSSEPTEPKLNWAYYNTETGCSYIWNGTKWDLLSKAGAKGEKGKSIVWQGELDSEPTEPELNWAYYNTETGCSYIWDGTKWDLLSKVGKEGEKGETGKSIIWKGELDSDPSEPEFNWAYYNKTDGCSYIYNGTAWTLLAQKGDKGDKGNNGTSITWLGSFTSSEEISSHVTMGVYYNITDGCSYIYDGINWNLLARKGSDGTSSSGDGGFRWRGDFAADSEITAPATFDVYFNTTTGCAYIYNGTEWKLLTRAGTNGKGIVWMGSLPSSDPIVNPVYMNAYYNTTDGCSYIYNGSEWVLLAKAGADGLPYDGSGTVQGKLPLMSAYSIGDVLLNDGTIVPYNANKVAFTDEQKRRAVAVMYGNEYGIPAGWLGIYNSCGGAKSGIYAWAAGETGTNTIFNDIICECTSSTDSDGTKNVSFTRDLDGSDNWTYIKSVDPNGILYPSKNYPAFDYVQKYASRFALTDEYVSGWYMPSLAELYNIYRSKTVLNKVLYALGGIELYNATYWSSSQEYYYYHGYDSDGYAMYVNFADGTVDHTNKTKQMRVCVVRTIDKEPPDPIQNLHAGFFSYTYVNDILVSWTKPSNADFSYVLISYTKDGTEIISRAPVTGNNSYTISNVERDGAVYVFTVSAVDKAGNISETKTTSLTAPAN